MKISACYIVKDEADELRRSLKSVAQAADEIIVVSTAGEMSVATTAVEYGAQIYDIPWEGDFSRARNFALEQTSGDIVIFLDADEYFLHPESVRHAIEELAEEHPSFDIIMIGLYSLITKDSFADALFGRSPRILHMPGLHYHGMIHEQASRDDGADRTIIYADDRLSAGHTGYLRERGQEKIRRNITFLEKDAALNGWSAMHAAYLADCYFGLHDYERALALSKEALSGEMVRIGGNSQIYHQILECMRALHYPDEEMLLFADEALAYFPSLPDFYAQRGMILCGLVRYEEAAESLIVSLERYDHGFSDLYESSYFNDHIAARVAERIWRIYRHLGDEASAEIWEAKEASYHNAEKPAGEDGMGKIKITACYIVRDDEKRLRRSIESLRSHYDELIVVDTGSLDGTKETARSLGADVYDVPWTDDFAAARNAALAHVHGDWIIFLDSDEYFSPETGGNLRSVIERAHAEDTQVILVALHDIDEDTGETLMDSHVPRMFRNTEGRRYDGRIHEELRDGEAAPAPVWMCPREQLLLIHTGYSAARFQEKGERNLRILLEEIRTSKTPERYWRYLAETYDGRGDVRMAEKYALLDVGQGRRSVIYASACMRILLRIYGENPALRAQYLETSERAARDYPEIPEFRAELAEAYAAFHRYAEAVLSAEQACTLPAPEGLEPSSFTEEMRGTLRHRQQMWKTIAARAKELRISACVFVKDDAKDMEQWLANTDVYADERIVVDTGSTDGTRSLAEQSGATVVDFAWRDDFAAARNASLHPATGDWATVLDADETFFDPTEVRPYLAMIDVMMPDTDAVLLPIVHVDEDDGGREMGRAPHIRLVRLGRGLHYAGEVHEALRKKEGLPKLYHETVALSIRHVGYSSGRIRAKHERNLALLERRIAEKGLQPGDYRYLADTCYGLGRYASALLYARAALSEDVRSLGAQSHLYHLVLDAMEQENVLLSEQIAFARDACAAFPDMPDFHARLGLLLVSASEIDALAELTRAEELAALSADTSGESSRFVAWGAAVAAARARLLFAAGDPAAAEETLAHAFSLDGAREESLDVYMEMHAGEDAGDVLAGLRERFGTDAETLSYLARFADSYGWRVLAEKAAAAWEKETGKDMPAPSIYANLHAWPQAERGAQLIGTLAGMVHEMPEILLALERDTSVTAMHLYHRLRDLLPGAMQMFWRHYDEPDAAPLPETREGYDLLRAAFVHHAKAAQMERFLVCAAAYGADEMLRLAEELTAAERYPEAIATREVYAALGGTQDTMHHNALARAYAQIGVRAEARVHLTQALALTPEDRRAKELMELIG